jgi:hypothetical protein
MGVLEALWHVTAAHAPAGDVGRLADQDLADEMHWPGPPAELVAALVGAGALEQHPELRLVVHGWSEHADSTLRHKLKRAGRTFWDGSPAFGHARPTAVAADPPPVDDVSATRHDVMPTDGDPARPDKNVPAVSVSEPSPAPTPPPAPEPTDNPPPGPPASAGGRAGGGKVYKPGDTLPTGQTVLEVDPEGRPLVVRRSEASAPTLTASAEAAVQRIVAFASKIGYRFDRTARRRFRERMLGGESEAQILAPYKRQAEALEELELQADPPPTGADTADQELDQALRLATGPPRPAAPRPSGAHP